MPGPEFSGPEFGAPGSGASEYGGPRDAGRPHVSSQVPGARGTPGTGEGWGAPPHGGVPQQWGSPHPGAGNQFGAEQGEVDLSRLPPPAPPQQFPGQPPPAVHGSQPSLAPTTGPGAGRTTQRPGTVTTAGVLAITGSALWTCSLGFAWLVLLALRDDLAGSGDVGTAFYHRITTIHHTLSQGAWLPAFGLPLAATVVALVMFARVNWSRYALTGLGVASIVASWTVLGTGGIGIPLICYVVLGTALIWTPGARRWFGGPRSGRPGGANFDTTPPGHRMKP